MRETTTKIIRQLPSNEKSTQPQHHGWLNSSPIVLASDAAAHLNQGSRFMCSLCRLSPCAIAISHPLRHCRILLNHHSSLKNP